MEYRKAGNKCLGILVYIADWLVIPFVENTGLYGGRLDNFELCRLSNVAIGYDGLKLNYVIY